MKTFTVVIQPTAHADIDEAVEWIQQYSPRRAERWLKRLQDRIQSLDTLPERCGLAEEAAAFELPIRELLYGKRNWKYRILFIVEDEIVSVVHIRRGARRFMTLEEW